MSSRVCPQCGARLAEGAERCDLCGSPLSGDAAQTEPVPADDDIPEPGGSSAASVYCNACGWENPPGAKFCSRCGDGLQNVATTSSRAVKRVGRVPEASSREGTGPDSSEDHRNSSVARHVAVLVGISLLIVVALYMVTVISRQRVESDAAAAVEAPAEVRSAAVIEEFEGIPIAERYAPTVDSLRSAMASSADAAGRDAHRALVDFLLDIGRVDRAAIEQQRLARETGRVDDWRRAGNLLSDWMEAVQSERKTDVALMAIEAYGNVLDEVPGDLDARADLGWAYQYDPQHPMEAIRQTNMVLEEDPEHLAANYNRGVFLLRINRVADAISQFERVAELADAGSPYERQAEAWISTIRQRRSDQP